MARHGSIYTKLIQSKEWQQGLRLQVLSEQQGLCKWCKDKGYIVTATEVHHIVEVESGKTEAEQRWLMFARSNCVGLCHKCHADYHKAQRYHSSDKVLERQQERLKVWADAMVKRFDDRHH